MFHSPLTTPNLLSLRVENKFSRRAPPSTFKGSSPPQAHYIDTFKFHQSIQLLPELASINTHEWVNGCMQKVENQLNSLCLFDDCAFHERQNNEMFVLGRVQRMGKKRKKGYIEYVKPVSLDERRKAIFTKYSF